MSEFTSILEYRNFSNQKSLLVWNFRGNETYPASVISPGECDTVLTVTQFRIIQIKRMTKIVLYCLNRTKILYRVCSEKATCKLSVQAEGQWSGTMELFSNCPQGLIYGDMIDWWHAEANVIGHWKDLLVLYDHIWKILREGCQVAQSDKWPTLDFHSHMISWVVGWSPLWASCLAGGLLEILSLFLSLCPSACSLPLSDI